MVIHDGDTSPWHDTDIVGLSGPSFASDATIHLDYGFMIEPGQQISDASWTLAGEIHNDDGALGRHTSPPFYVSLTGDHMGIAMVAGGSTASEDQNRTLWTDPQALERGHDYHMQVDAKFAQDDTGFLHVVRDGQTIVDYHGPIGYGTGTYWMPDLYRDPSDNSTQAVNYHNMEVWTGPA